MSGKFFIIFIIFSAFIFAGNVSAAITDKLGESVGFFVDKNYDELNRGNIIAIMKKVSDRAYFYVENNYFNSLTAIEQADFLNAQDALAQEFDNVIYPMVVDFYGNEWNPGIDGDNKITFLFTPMDENAGGYFRTNDENRRSVIGDSNEREMVYFNAKHINNSRAQSLIAHEFQHLINYYQKDKLQNITEEVWLNEMRSEYAPTIIGYDDDYTNSNIRYRENFFMATPNDPIVEWLNRSEDYGVINFLAQYLGGHYGDTIFSSMIKSNKVGIPSINEVLKENGFVKTFSDIFSEWTVANIINDCAVADGQYCYKNKNLSGIKIDPTTTYNILSPYTSVAVGGTIDDWSARWYKFTGSNLTNKALKLEFEGSSADSVFRVPYIVENKDNTKIIKYMDITDNNGVGYIKDFGSNIQNVIAIPASHQVNGDGNGSANKDFMLTANIIENLEVPETIIVDDGEDDFFVGQFLDLPDGSLVRGAGDYRVYIIQGNYKRHILDGKIFGFYGHMSWEDINEVDPKILANYTESFLVRALGDKRVYEINGDKTKHWLNMSAESFSLSGRKWDSISIINTNERDFYSTGADVKL